MKKSEKMSVTIAHFNDAYLPALAPHWHTARKEHCADAIVTCGGDVFNPSMISTVTRGKHVPPLLRALDVAVSCIGNHDLDFGSECFGKLSSQCGFPWLCSNLKIEGTVESVVLAKNGVRVGFFGVVGTDFVSCLNFDTVGLVAEDVVVCARRMVAQLQDKCDTIVALTHCRMPDDRRITSVCGEGGNKFGLVLGAHDHELQEEAPFLYKAGCDWNYLVKATFEAGKWTCQTIAVTAKTHAPDQVVLDVIKQFESELQKGLGKVLANINGELDARTALIRKAESPVGNWICDIVKHQFAVLLDRPVDFVLINCGSFRGDRVYTNPFTVEKLLGLLPFNDLTLAYSVKGSKLIEAMEAGCSKHPAENGGFPSISSGARVVIRNKKCVTFEMDGIAIEADRDYVMVTKSFLAQGKDGYDCLSGHCTPLMDPEFALLLSSMVRRHTIMAHVAHRLKTQTAPKAKAISGRFIEKLRKHDDSLYTITAHVEGRIVIETE